VGKGSFPACSYRLEMKLPFCLGKVPCCHPNRQAFPCGASAFGRRAGPRGWGRGGCGSITSSSRSSRVLVMNSPSPLPTPGGGSPGGEGHGSRTQRERVSVTVRSREVRTSVSCVPRRATLLCLSLLMHSPLKYVGAVFWGLRQ